MWLTNLFGKVKNINSELADFKTKESRLKTCDGCPLKNEDFHYLFFFKKKDVKQCSICGCALDDKVLWLDEKCPLDKW